MLSRKAMPQREATQHSRRPDMAPAKAVIRRVDDQAAGPAVADRPRPAQKTMDRKRQDIRDSARGEDCTVRIPGVCTFDPEKTIWSHAPLGAAGKGRGIKALDLCGAYCCTACDAVVDGQAPMPAGMTRAMVLLDWFMGHMRSLVRLQQKGLT